MIDNRKCPITDSSDVESFYISENHHVMTSDQRIIKGQLEKIIFKESGIVANRNRFTESDIQTLYKDDYELNTSGHEEHVFFTKAGPISRSQVYFNWIEPFIENDFAKIVEIGCGEGRVLEKIVSSHPNQDIVGYDGSRLAVEIGRNKRLNILQKIFLKNDNFPEADLFILIGVLEHVEDITSMIKGLIDSLSSKGRLILSIPVQDYIGYDVFFTDHIWHFTVKQFSALLRSCGLKIISLDSNNPINHGFGLFICEKEEKGFENINLTGEVIIQKNNISYWKSKIEKANDLCYHYKDTKIVAFGASEFFTFLYAYSNLSSANIVACIDDSKEGTLKHGIPVKNSKWLDKNKVDVILLTVNEKYNDIIRNKLSHLDVEIISLFD